MKAVYTANIWCNMRQQMLTISSDLALRFPMLGLLFLSALGLRRSLAALPSPIAIKGGSTLCTHPAGGTKKPGAQAGTMTASEATQAAMSVKGNACNRTSLKARACAWQICTEALQMLQTGDNVWG